MKSSGLIFEDDKKGENNPVIDYAFAFYTYMYLQEIEANCVFSIPPFTLQMM